jgi:probable F420-dependent oxidoreductase
VLGAPHDRNPPLWGPYNEHDAFHDPFVLFSFMAALTTRLEFSTSVLVLPQRQTVLVAKQAADLAVLSGDRFRLAVGVGWNYVEYDALGQEFTTRGRREEEQIGLLRGLWSDQLVTAKSGAERINNAGINPRPTKTIPLWLGGFSEAAFRRGVELGDGFSFAGMLDEALKGSARLYELLEGHQRDPDKFGTELVMIPPAPEHRRERWPRKRPVFLDQTAATVARWAEAGGTHAAVFTTWMGLQTLDDHLAYAEKAIAAARR